MTNGHCLCGTLQYAIDGQPISTSHCCCESCRRATSSPVTTFTTIRRCKITFSGDEPGLYTSSPGIQRQFCRTCDLPIGYRAIDRTDEISPYATSLNDPTHVAAEYHEFYSERLSWIELSDTLPRYEKEGPN